MDLVPIELIQRKILLIRGRKVMIDRDLADMYGVENKGIESGREKKYKPVS